jgi:hypothetical protein
MGKVLLHDCAVPYLSTIRSYDGFSCAIGEVNIVAVIPKAINLTTFMFEKILDRIGPIVLCFTRAEWLLSSTADKKKNRKGR